MRLNLLYWYTTFNELMPMYKVEKGCKECSKYLFIDSPRLNDPEMVLDWHRKWKHDQFHTTISSYDLRHKDRILFSKVFKQNADKLNKRGKKWKPKPKTKSLKSK